MILRSMGVINIEKKPLAFGSRRLFCMGIGCCGLSLGESLLAIYLVYNILAVD